MVTHFKRGQKARLSDLTLGTDLYVGVQISGPGLVFDISCFGLDADERLSDDRYFIFYNQPKSPEESLQLLGAQAGDTESFRVTLDRVPASVHRLAFTATIDGDGTMAQAAPGCIRIVAGGEEVARYAFDGSEFSSERAVMLGDFYRKDGWRFAAVGQGFDGGLAALLTHFGGEVEEDEPAPAPAQPASAPPPFAVPGAGASGGQAAGGQAAPPGASQMPGQPASAGGVPPAAPFGVPGQPAPPPGGGQPAPPFGGPVPSSPGGGHVAPQAPAVPLGGQPAPPFGGAPQGPGGPVAPPFGGPVPSPGGGYAAPPQGPGAFAPPGQGGAPPGVGGPAPAGGPVVPPFGGAPQGPGGPVAPPPGQGFVAPSAGGPGAPPFGGAPQGGGGFGQPGQGGAASLGGVLERYRGVEDGRRWSQPNPELVRVDLTQGGGQPVLARQGSMVLYHGDVDFGYKSSGFRGRMTRWATGEGMPSMMRCTGNGQVFLAEEAVRLHPVELQGDAIVVASQHVLAFDETLEPEVRRIDGHGIPGGSLFALQFQGHGTVVITTRGEPLVLPVTPMTFADANAIVAWSAAAQVLVANQVRLRRQAYPGHTGETTQLQFRGAPGNFAIVQPYEI
ncbi:TerD family protein [Streptomyces millisiae]|uniref:TerD family protein n=1 Tax=Streptomyces millisiae TaxID=3075542 RepID=A0ABU2LYT0_9ACTN|nr:TerD family protein [Streptomyces sp. DSM 44918]MDT0322700.1 TerD family protein [Streptomyces sp. DSM 44918]